MPSNTDRHHNSALKAWGLPRLKVLFLTSDVSAVAGVGLCLVDALGHLDQSDITPLVVGPGTMGRRPTILPNLRRLQIPFLTRSLDMWLPSPDNWGARDLFDLLRNARNRAWAVAKTIEENAINLVYSNGLPCIDGALAARLTKRPHIWHLHEAVRDNPDLRRYLPIRVIEEAVARLSDAVIVNSNFLAHEFKAASIKGTLRVIHNGIDADAIGARVPDHAGASVRQELGLPPEAPIVLAVGTVAPRKGYDTLTEAAARVAAEVSGTVFLVAGAETREHGAALRRKLDSLGLAQTFRLLGARQDVPRLLAAADIFVHSARQESFGRVLLEAMALEKPVVATRCGGPEEIVQDRVTGYLVAVDAPGEIARRLVELLRSTELRRRQGRAGRERAVGAFSLGRYARNIQQVIHEVIGNVNPEAHRTHSL